MIKIKYIVIILLSLIITTVVIAQTRRTKEEEFVRKTINVEELQTINVVAKACDPDGDPVVIVAEDLPVGATLSDAYLLSQDHLPINDPNCAECFQDPNTSWYGADLTWTPTQEQQGTYKVYIHAADDAGGDDWVVYIINVANKNRPPIL
jgi:type II secretory pathway pseudopilin PulG